jgi:NadR type nicotinamide-nucleotide adenylyltransferase
VAALAAAAGGVTRGLVLGKFMPPHAGHLHLVETARARVDELTVLVCSLADEPIPGTLRAAWMRELVPWARVVHVTDENPSEPHEHPRFWEIWVDSVRRAEPRAIDVVFSSEPYGDELARRLGARHVLVDRDRARVPVSGSAIRTEPFAHWEYIPAPVRPYFVARVVVTGSESTGKTTLAVRLAQHYGTVAAPEFARDYLDAKPTPLDASDVEPIARGQIALEDRLRNEVASATADGGAKVVFFDTDLASTAVYARHYYGDCPPWIEQAARDRRAELYLLCHPDVPWVPDPQRDRPHARAEMHALFERKLRELGARWVDVRGDWDERERIAIGAVDALLLRGS